MKYVVHHLQMQTVLDEIIFGGQVLETSSVEVMKAVEEISKYALSSSLSPSLPLHTWLYVCGIACL